MTSGTEEIIEGGYNYTAVKKKRTENRIKTHLTIGPDSSSDSDQKHKWYTKVMGVQIAKKFAKKMKKSTEKSLKSLGKVSLDSQIKSESNEDLSSSSYRSLSKEDIEIDQVNEDLPGSKNQTKIQSKDLIIVKDDDSVDDDEGSEIS